MSGRASARQRPLPQHDRADLGRARPGTLAAAVVDDEAFEALRPVRVGAGEAAVGTEQRAVGETARQGCDQPLGANGGGTEGKVQAGGTEEVAALKRLKVVVLKGSFRAGCWKADYR